MEVRETVEFAEWLDDLRDRAARARIRRRIHQLSRGLFGDVRSLRGALWEARIHYGPGYRLYYTRRGDTLILLLCGGDKRSQDRDIARARRMIGELP